VGRHTIRVSNADRVVFPDSGVTKGEIVAYYRQVAELMLPHLRGRPLMLQRVTKNIEGEVFYQKEIGRHYPDWIHRARVAKAGGWVTHVVCDNAATLVYLANQGCITLHPWLSRADDPERPDRMIFDLDPGTGGVDDARFAATAMRRLLSEAGLEPLLMATGSRGFHLILPIRRSEPWQVVREIAYGLAEALARRAPDRLTVEFRKEQRRGRLFLDYVRNTYAQTAVAPYSVRVRPGAPVAVPLDWDELDSSRPDGWSVRSVLARLERTPDPWRSAGRRAHSLASARRFLQAELGSSWEGQGR
jgi:bifunctional non-homologous end joining protein LigD